MTETQRSSANTLREYMPPLSAWSTPRDQLPIGGQLDSATRPLIDFKKRRGRYANSMSRLAIAARRAAQYTLAGPRPLRHK
jgi:hypothetical protein